jgi:formylglycine-generating enzyme required for sulfatase activity
MVPYLYTNCLSYFRGELIMNARQESRSLFGLLFLLVIPLLGLPLAGQDKAGDKADKLPKALANSIDMVLIRIDPGKFTMGSPKTEIKREEGEDEHQIEISKTFYMGKYEVTQAQFQAVVGKNPSYFKGDKLPVDSVSWADAKVFCDKLSKKENKVYTLPTEAEWEYACRAGTKTSFCLGNVISTDQINYNGNKIYGDGKKGVFRKKTMEVGSLPPNKWGLHDMHGNVWEWCEDWYNDDYYKTSPKQDPKGAEKGESRVLRGGSWESAPEECRSANRGQSPPGEGYNHVGFRVVLRTLPAE